MRNNKATIKNVTPKAQVNILEYLLCRFFRYDTFFQKIYRIVKELNYTHKFQLCVSSLSFPARVNIESGLLHPTDVTIFVTFPSSKFTTAHAHPGRNTPLRISQFSDISQCNRESWPLTQRWKVVTVIKLKISNKITSSNYFIKNT